MATRVTVSSLARFACRQCARWTEFEQPPCLDGHGAECPEWYCTECGAASLVGWDIEPRVTGSASRVA